MWVMVIITAKKETTANKQHWRLEATSLAVNNWIYGHLEEGGFGLAMRRDGIIIMGCQLLILITRTFQTRLYRKIIIYLSSAEHAVG